MEERTASKRVAALVLVMMTSALGARAQTTGSIAGSVIDQTGAALPGVAITAVNEATGRTRTAATSGQGTFRIDALPPSGYTVRAELKGFKTSEHRGVVLAGTGVVTLNISLPVAGAGEAVDVVAEAPLVNVTQNQIKTEVDTQMMDDLPINGRRFQDFTLLVPGVHIDFGSTRAGGTDAIAFFGFNERNKALFVDGIDLNDELTRGGTGITNAPRTQYSMEAIQETEVLRNQFSAEVGRAQAGVVNVLTRSGGNEFGGRVFGFFRDDAFDKKNEFATGKIPFNQQQFGGRLSGPFVKDRTHWLVSYEGWRQDAVATIRIPPTLVSFIPDPRTEIPVVNNKDNFFAKLSHSFTPAHLMNLSYVHDRGTASGQAAAADAAADARFTETRRDHFVTARLTSSLGSSTNELRVAVSRTKTDRPATTSAPEQLFPGLRIGTPNNMPQGRQQKNFIFADVYSRQLRGVGDHAVKLGAQANIVRYPTKLNLFQLGQYTFARAVPAGPDNRPTQYILGRYAFDFSDLDSNSFGFFVQDDWKVTRRLTLNLGLRYDLEVYKGAYEGADYPSFSGFDDTIRFLISTLPGGTNAATIYKSRDTDKNNFQPRVGFNWQATRDGRTSVRAGYGIFTEGGHDPISVQGTLRKDRAETFVAPGAVFPLLSFYPGRPSDALLNTFFRISLVNQFPGVFVNTAYAHQFSVGFEREVGWQTAIAVDYAGIRSRENPRDVNANHPVPGTPGFPFLPSGAAVTYNASNGRVNADSVQVQVRRRFSQRVGFLLSYTWLKANQDGPSTSPNFRDEDYGPTPNDVRNHFVASANARLPLDFDLSLILNAASAFPYNWTAGRDTTGDRVPGNDRPSGVTFNSLRGDGFFSLGARLSKLITFAKRYRLELIAEAFNLTNTVNYNNYIGVETSPFFRQPTQALDPFQAQFGFRFDF